MPAIYLKSAYEAPSEVVQAAVDRGEVVVVQQRHLTPEILAAHRGLVTGIQVDQDHLMGLRPALERFLDAGGRWFFNGHLVRPLVEGLGQFRPLLAPKRADLDLSSVQTHPIFDGIDLKQLETNKGVAGFYGRGCNPPPEGAVVVNGLGPSLVPVDWVWARPSGGRFFSHSGNDLGSLGLEWGLAPELTQRILRWAAGGPCVGPEVPPPADPSRWPLAESPVYGGPRRGRSRGGRRIVGVSSGTFYHIHSLEGPAYTGVFDVLCAPEDLEAVLEPSDILWVPCRTPAQRMVAIRDGITRHLGAGGTVVALGESRSDLWLPVAFTSTPTNWWWWREPGADLGVEVTPEAAEHPLMVGIGKKEVTWHLHGWFAVPDGATVLARDREGRAILYEDRVSTPGTLVVSSLDPLYHHGSHFMPATTRFLDRFVPNLRARADA